MIKFSILNFNFSKYKTLYYITLMWCYNSNLLNSNKVANNDKVALFIWIKVVQYFISKNHIYKFF